MLMLSCGDDDVTLMLSCLQSEEEGLKAKQEETVEAAQQADQLSRGTGEAGAGLAVPVQNGEGDSLNLSAGFIQVSLPEFLFLLLLHACKLGLLGTYSHQSTVCKQPSP